MSTKIQDGAIIISGVSSMGGVEHDHKMTIADVRKAVDAFETLFGDTPRVQVRFESVPSYGCDDNEPIGSIDWKDVDRIGRTFVHADIGSRGRSDVCGIRPAAAVGLAVRLIPRA